MPAISIITTVYDAKDYLPLTVQSILAQSFADFELILVEDGSPNGCGELCDELARTDPRIRVVHKKNGGPASAANAGWTPPPATTSAMWIPTICCIRIS